LILPDTAKKRTSTPPNVEKPASAGFFLFKTHTRTGYLHFQEVQKALKAPAFRDKVQSDGTEIVGLGQAGFPDYLRQDLQKWKRAVELSGAKVD